MATRQAHEEGGDPLPDLVRDMIEAVARYMSADKGHWRIDFTFDDGHLVKWTRQEGPAGAHALEQFAGT